MIETMLRMYLMQNWFNLSDAGIGGTIQVQDATTLPRFRHLIKESGIGETFFVDVRVRLEKAV